MGATSWEEYKFSYEQLTITSFQTEISFQNKGSSSQDQINDSFKMILKM